MTRLTSENCQLVDANVEGENKGIVRSKALTIKLPAPAEVKASLPLPAEFAGQVEDHRRQIADILSGRDQRMLVIVGPCSIHDTQAAIEYGRRLKVLSEQVEDKCLLVMRAYFEKPRTTVGWKGMLYDPEINGAHDINSGISLSRGLLLELVGMGLPVATEALSPLATGYIDDLISWVAIGARTTESQTHREMASALPMPVGFKNGTDGSIDIAIHALQSASHPHTFVGMCENGEVAMVQSSGNPDTHIVLRGGKSQGRAITNYDLFSVKDVSDKMVKARLQAAIIIDCSHENSGKDHSKQPEVFQTVIANKKAGIEAVKGAMLESFLEEGRQDSGEMHLQYGCSITDACIDWNTTEKMILDAFKAL